MSDYNIILLNKRRKRKTNHNLNSNSKENRFKLDNKDFDVDDTTSIKKSNIIIDENLKENFKNVYNNISNSLKVKRKSTKLKTLKKQKIKNLPMLEEAENKEENSLELDNFDTFTKFVGSENLENLLELKSIYSFDSAKFSPINEKRHFIITDLDDAFLSKEKTVNSFKISPNQEELTYFAIYAKETKSCSICFENVNFTDKHYLRCGHVFHFNCISEWLKVKNICPICKQVPIEININILNENFSLFSAADFSDIIMSDDIRDNRILRSIHERNNLINDITLFIEVVDRHRYIVIFIIYIFFFLSYKVLMIFQGFNHI